MATVFSLSTVKDKVKIKAGDEYLPQVDTPTFLGVKLDPRLTWKPHLEEIEARGIRRLAMMRKLSGTKWGAYSKILKKVYTGAVRPVLEYSSSSWIAAAKSTKSRLDRVQNRGLRTMARKLLIQGEKSRRLQNHPLHTKLQAGTKNRLKRQRPNHLLKAQQRQNDDILDCKTDPQEKLTPQQWLPNSPGFQIRQNIPGITGKQQQNDHVLRALALEEIYKRYPSSKWTHVYTDGSAEKVTKNAGCGAYIQILRRPPIALSSPCGANSTNFRAELSALQTAADCLLYLKDIHTKIVFLSDSLSALQTLQSTPTEEVTERLRQTLNQLAKTAITTVQWIPAHCDIKGNEKADNLAKEGRRLPQPETIMSYREAKTVIKHRWKVLLLFPKSLLDYIIITTTMSTSDINTNKPGGYQWSFLSTGYACSSTSDFSHHKLYVSVEKMKKFIVYYCHTCFHKCEAKHNVLSKGKKLY